MLTYTHRRCSSSSLPSCTMLNSSRLPTYADICRRMPTYADICSDWRSTGAASAASSGISSCRRMPNVFRRMLTYALTGAVPVQPVRRALGSALVERAPRSMHRGGGGHALEGGSAACNISAPLPSPSTISHSKESSFSLVGPSSDVCRSMLTYADVC